MKSSGDLDAVSQVGDASLEVSAKSAPHSADLILQGGEPVLLLGNFSNAFCHHSQWKIVLCL